jgi:hypothetical protein
MPYVLVMQQPRQQLGPEEVEHSLWVLGMQGRTLLSVVPHPKGHTPAPHQPPPRPSEAPDREAGQAALEAEQLQRVGEERGRDVVVSRDGHATERTQQEQPGGTASTEEEGRAGQQAEDSPAPTEEEGRAGQHAEDSPAPTDAAAADTQETALPDTMEEAAPHPLPTPLPLHIRLTNGSSMMCTLPSNATLATLLDHIDEHRTDVRAGTPPAPYRLILPHPQRRAFSSSEFECTLLELGLQPRTLLQLELRRAHIATSVAIKPAPQQEQQQGEGGGSEEQEGGLAKGMGESGDRENAATEALLPSECCLQVRSNGC